MSKEYETVIGLEVHVELATKTKIFCGCPTAFGGLPNTHTCPVCTGMPGTLPVLNKQVVEYAIAVGLATGCSITRRITRFPSYTSQSAGMAAWRLRRRPAKNPLGSMKSIWRRTPGN